MLDARHFFFDEYDLGVDGLTGLLEFAGDIGGAFAAGEVAANGFLLLRQVNGGMFEGGSGDTFEFAVFAAPVFIQVFRREEPAINDSHTGNTACLYEVHEMPVT